LKLSIVQNSNNKAFVFKLIFCKFAFNFFLTALIIKTLMPYCKNIMKLSAAKKLCFFLTLTASTALAQTEGKVASGSNQTDTTITTIQPQPAPIIVEQTWLIDPAIVQPRLQGLQKEIQMTYNPMVHQFVEYFAYRKPSFTKTMLERKDVYFPIYEKYLKKYGLPDELKYLSLIESGLNPKVLSRAGAGGLWQFMPRTARLDFGMRIDEYVDERFDPEKSTESACRYLKQLYNIFGDWQMVLASYNTGPGNVKRAIRKCGGGQTFWEIYNCLPRETRGYVPQYIGMIYMMNFHADHEIFPEASEVAIAHDTIHVNSFLDLDKLATMSNMSLEDIQKLNPHILTGILPGFTRNFILRLPKSEMAYFRTNRPMIMDSATKLPSVIIENLQPGAEVIVTQNGTVTTNQPVESTNTISYEQETQPAVAAAVVEDDIEDIVINKKPKKQYYTVRKRDNLTDIADKFDVELYDLKVWNKLHRSTIIPGQRLVIYKEAAITSSVKYARSNRKDKEAVSKGKVRFHKVQDGDTLWNISMRYGGISIDKLKKLNKMRSSTVKSGMKIRVS
jgi:membrane-bound lytic murein transglycosylase D